MLDTPILAYIPCRMGKDLLMQIANSAAVTAQTIQKLAWFANCGLKIELATAKKKEFLSSTPLRYFSRIVNAHVLSLHSQ